MALATMIEKLNEARNAYEAQKNALGTDAEKALAEAIGPLLPPGYAFKWRQYTPYFNDGDACVFSVREPEFEYIGEDPELEGDAIELYSVSYRLKETDSTTFDYYGTKVVLGEWGKDQCTALENMWKSLPEDFLESVFGDHVQVVIKPDGTSSRSGCSHD